MATLKDMSWNPEWLKQATWKEFKTLYFEHPVFKQIPLEKREAELYSAFFYLTDKKVSSLHKKYLFL